MARLWMPGRDERCTGRITYGSEVTTRVSQIHDARCFFAAEPGSDMCEEHLANGGGVIHLPDPDER